MGGKYSLFLIPLVVMILLGVISCKSSAVSTAVPVVIARCHDGDTCTTREGEKLRFACVDAPELRQPYGEASRDHLRSLLKNRERSAAGGGSVRVDRRGSDRQGRGSADRYGRTIAVLYIPDGKDWRAVQEIQARAGTVWANERYKRDCPIWKAIDREANEARKNRRGLFANQNAIAPWEWRRQNR